MTERSKSRHADDQGELAELPALPDGGLSANMPAWLQQAPAFAPPDEEPDAGIDLNELASGLQLPDWLGDLAARVQRERMAEPIPAVSSPTQKADVDPPPAVPITEAPSDSTEQLVVDETPAGPPPFTRISLPAKRIEAGAPEPTEPPYETPYTRISALLVLFLIGLIVFMVWASTN